MKLKILILVLALFCCGCSNDKYFKVVESREIARISANAETSQLISNVAPAIVAIESTSKTGSSLGSGVCVKSGGYVLTNYHVVSNNGSIKLHLHNGENANAILLYFDSNLDVAILKADKAIPFLPMGNSDNLVVGQDVISVGSPISLTFNQTFTKGIISALNRTLQISLSNGIGVMHNLIQHDAAINSGNSGGPLINSCGEVVGINTLKISQAEGLGFAIPIKNVQSVIAKVENTKITQPQIGVFGYDANIENIANVGFFVKDVMKNSSCFNAKILKGDIITCVNGNKVKNSVDFIYELNKYNLGDYVVLELDRNGIKTRALVKIE